MLSLLNLIKSFFSLNKTNIVVRAIDMDKMLTKSRKKQVKVTKIVFIQKHNKHKIEDFHRINK